LVIVFDLWSLFWIACDVYASLKRTVYQLSRRRDIPRFRTSRTNWFVLRWQYNKNSLFYLIYYMFGKNSFYSEGTQFRKKYNSKHFRNFFFCIIWNNLNIEIQIFDHTVNWWSMLKSFWKTLSNEEKRYNSSVLV